MASASSVPLEPPSPSLSSSSPALNVPAPAFERVATELEPAQLPTRPAVECAPHAEPVRGYAVDMGVAHAEFAACSALIGALARRVHWADEEEEAIDFGGDSEWDVE